MLHCLNNALLISRLYDSWYCISQNKEGKKINFSLKQKGLNRELVSAVFSFGRLK